MCWPITAVSMLILTAPAYGGHVYIPQRPQCRPTLGRQLTLSYYTCKLPCVTPRHSALKRWRLSVQVAWAVLIFCLVKRLVMRLHSKDCIVYRHCLTGRLQSAGQMRRSGIGCAARGAHAASRPGTDKAVHTMRQHTHAVLLPSAQSPPRRLGALLCLPVRAASGGQAVQTVRKLHKHQTTCKQC